MSILERACDDRAKLAAAFMQIGEEFDALAIRYNALAAELAEARQVLAISVRADRFNEEIEKHVSLAHQFVAQKARIHALEAALREANTDMKAVWIKTGEGLDGLKRTEVALGLTSAETKGEDQ